MALLSLSLYLDSVIIEHEMTRGLYERTPEIREKMRQSQLGHRRLTADGRRRLSKANLGKRMSAEACKKIGRKARSNMLKKWRDPEYREKMSAVGRQSRLRQKLPRKMTSIECLLRDEFRKRRLKFEMHKTMFERFQPDFVFEQAKLIVQADGDYWHGLPRGRTQDAAFNQMATGDGWSVWRFGEREIHMHAPACARAVARFVRDHQ